MVKDGPVGIARALRIRLLALIMGLALLAPISGCSEPEMGVVVDGERLPVIDMHLHPGEWSEVPPSTREFLAQNFPFPFNTDPEGLANRLLSPEGIAEQLDEAGVSRGVLFAVYAPRSVGVASNEFVAETVDAKRSRFYGFASLRVDNWDAEADEQLAALEQGLAQPNFVGIKLAHTHQHFRMDDPAYYGIYALAGELQKPVYLHTGPSPTPGTAREAPYTDPAYLEDAIASHPDTTFILGHLGYDFVNHELGDLDTCIALAQSYDNVYLEPSALGSERSDPTGENLPEAMRRMREAGLVDRIIYGSDGPQSPGFVADYLDRTVAAMRRADYSVDEMRAVLAGNFARVFDVPVPEL